ncbi:MAG: neutral/alkaline non-lysosomal ceramidase N-terminal domain-containing protein, partial [Bdellovibrionota bacterium]
MSQAGDLFELGFAKRDITPPPKGEMLYGYVDPKHRALKVGMPLHARAVVIKTSGSKPLALVCLEICSVAQAVRDAILERIRRKFPEWAEDDLIVSATHTHCAPGGHYHDVLYSVASLGWYPHVLECYADGAAAAILEAYSVMKPGRIRYAEGAIAAEKPAAFNRSIAAWNLNPDVTPYTFTDRNRALDRTMRHYRFEDVDGRFLGCVNDFAVHCTSMHRDQSMIHPDNKGVAAELMEKEVGGICIFVQGAAGDVSPNFQKFKGLIETRGTNRDDLVATFDNGRIQADKAREL